ncbi:hypothetical protein VYU27_001778 [Nannochloropsis oceanica]
MLYNAGMISLSDSLSNRKPAALLKNLAQTPTTQMAWGNYKLVHGIGNVKTIKNVTLYVGTVLAWSVLCAPVMHGLPVSCALGCEHFGVQAPALSTLSVSFTAAKGAACLERDGVIVSRKHQWPDAGSFPVMRGGLILVLKI